MRHIPYSRAFVITTLSRMFTTIFLEHGGQNAYTGYSYQIVEMLPASVRIRKMALRKISQLSFTGMCNACALIAQHARTRHYNGITECRPSTNPENAIGPWEFPRSVARRPTLGIPRLKITLRIVRTSCIVHRTWGKMTLTTMRTGKIQSCLCETSRKPFISPWTPAHGSIHSKCYRPTFLLRNLNSRGTRN